MIKFGWDFMMWENNNKEARPLPPGRKDGDNYDIKTMWHRMAQGDNPPLLTRALVRVLDEIDCHEWEIPTNFPADVVEWIFIAETVSYDIQEWNAELIILDSKGHRWYWSYHPVEGAMTKLSHD